MEAPNNIKLNWYGSFSQGQGFSGSSEHMAVALENLGVDVRVMTFSSDLKRNMTKEGLAVKQKPFMLAPVGICYGFPNAFTSIMNKTKIGFTMFETSELPKGVNGWNGKTGKACDIINTLDVLFVPCEHNRELFKREGVSIPIEVVPLGYNPNYIKKTIRPQNREVFTFLIMGTLTIRKNVSGVLSAFSSLFADRDDVRLIIKTQKDSISRVEMNGLPNNVEIINRYATTDEIKQLFYDADCFVFPSRGEGFGLPPLEAMATGLPTILADNTGMSTFCNEKYNFPIKTFEEQKAWKYPKEWGNVGNWYEPDYNELKQAMKFVFEHREIAYKKGLASADWVRDNFTYEETAKRIIALVKKYTPCYND